MIQIEHTGQGKLRFATKDPSMVEVVLIDGKLFVHSEPLAAKTASPPSTVPSTNATPSVTSASKNKFDDKEFDFLKDAKSS